MRTRPRKSYIPVINSNKKKAVSTISRIMILVVFDMAMGPGGRAPRRQIPINKERLTKD